jgi:hypothetical protein
MNKMLASLVAAALVGTAVNSCARGRTGGRTSRRQGICRQAEKSQKSQEKEQEVP